MLRSFLSARHLAACFLIALTACSATTTSERPASSASSEGADVQLEVRRLPKQDFVFAFLTAGPQEGQLGQQEMGQAMAGHFANMKRLGEEGLLLLAGPLWEPRSDPDHRGLFVFDVSVPADALALAQTDPSIQAGVLEVSCHPFRSATDLRRLPDLIRARNAELEAEGPAQPGVPRAVRGYAIVTTTALDETALDRLTLFDAVLVSGQFGGALDGTSLLVVDAPDVDAARERLVSLGVDCTNFTFHGFFGSDTLPSLRDA